MNILNAVSRIILEMTQYRHAPKRVYLPLELYASLEIAVKRLCEQNKTPFIANTNPTHAGLMFQGVSICPDPVDVKELLERLKEDPHD